jgi:hypothetical protein
MAIAVSYQRGRRYGQFAATCLMLMQFKQVIVSPRRLGEVRERFHQRYTPQVNPVSSSRVDVW